MSAIWSSDIQTVCAGGGTAPGGVTRPRPIVDHAVPCPARQGARAARRQLLAQHVPDRTPSGILARLGNARAISLLLMYIIYLAGRTLFYASAAYF